MSPRHIALSALLLLIAAALPSPAAASDQPGNPLRIEITDHEIHVPLALSYHQLVLERGSDDIGWFPTQVIYPRSLGREQARDVSFRLPSFSRRDEWRVMGYRSPKFPSRLVYGKKQYSRHGASVIKLAPAEGLAPLPDVKGKILWKLGGTRLMVYNSQRGFQVFDVSEPTNPVRTGVIRLPVTGGWLLPLNADGSEVAMIGKYNNKDRLGKPVMFLLRVVNGMPELVAETPLQGRLRDAVAAGEQLHVLSEIKADKKGGTKLQITRIGYAALSAPKVLGRASFAGGEGRFELSNGRLFVSIGRVGQAVRHEIKTGGADGRLAPPMQGDSVNGFRVSLSNRQLLLQDIQNPALPPVVIPQDWKTDFVVPAGDFLVQVENDEDHQSGSSVVRVTPAGQPDVLVDSLVLGPGPVLALVRYDAGLFLAQRGTGHGGVPVLRTWSLSMGNPAHIQVLDSADHSLGDVDHWDLDLRKTQGHWLPGRGLVWVLPALPRGVWKSHLSSGGGLSFRNFGSSEVCSVLLPVKVDQARLGIEPALPIYAQTYIKNVSPSFAQDGLLYLSYDGTETGTEVVARSPRVRVPLRPSLEQVSSWLQVVDFTGKRPAVRPDVSLPGPLLNVVESDAQGALLICQSELTLNKESPQVRLIHACGYDGVHAHHLDTYITATWFNSATAVSGTHIYAVRETGSPGVVGVAYDPATGRLQQSSTWNLQTLPERLQVCAGHLLASSLGGLAMAEIVPVKGNIKPVAFYDTPADLCLPVFRAEETDRQDLWIPAGPYGVEFLQKQAFRP